MMSEAEIRVKLSVWKAMYNEAQSEIGRDLASLAIKILEEVLGD